MARWFNPWPFDPKIWMSRILTFPKGGCFFFPFWGGPSIFHGPNKNKSRRSGLAGWYPETTVQEVQPKTRVTWAVDHSFRDVPEHDSSRWESSWPRGMSGVRLHPFPSPMNPPGCQMQRSIIRTAFRDTWNGSIACCCWDPSSGRISMLQFSGHSMEPSKSFQLPVDENTLFTLTSFETAADWTGMRFRVKAMIADGDEASPQRRLYKSSCTLDRYK